MKLSKLCDDKKTSCREYQGGNLFSLSNKKFKVCAGLIFGAQCYMDISFTADIRLLKTEIACRLCRGERTVVSICRLQECLSVTKSSEPLAPIKRKRSFKRRESPFAVATLARVISHLRVSRSVLAIIARMFSVSTQAPGARVTGKAREA